MNNESLTIFDNRNMMMKNYVNKIRYPKILEIGIFKGDFFNFISNECNFTALDGVDIFEGITCSGDENGNNVINYDIGLAYLELTEKYKKYPNINLHRSDSTSYLSMIDDNYYDVIYIDGDHSYNGVKRDLELAFKKVKNNGYIMGHDYEMNFSKTSNNYDFGVKQAVNEFCSFYKQRLAAKAMDGCVSFCIKVQK